MVSRRLVSHLDVQHGSSAKVGPRLVFTLSRHVDELTNIKGNALTDMASDYHQIVAGNQGKGSWRSIKVDHSYARAGESFNPVNCRGLIVYYTDTKTIDQETTVSIAYVFFLGVRTPLQTTESELTGFDRSLMRLSTIMPLFARTSSRLCATT